MAPSQFFAAPTKQINNRHGRMKLWPMRNQGYPHTPGGIRRVEHVHQKKKPGGADTCSAIPA
jgi:hypothetical protein